MAYDEILEHRVRDVMSELGQADVIGKKMFGGVGFMLRGNMACGVLNDALIVRVGKENYEQAMAWRHARAFDITGRIMKGWVMVAAEGCAQDDDLKQMVRQGVEFALTLPAK